jgi:hypothetical protein
MWQISQCVFSATTLRCGKGGATTEDMSAQLQDQHKDGTKQHQLHPPHLDAVAYRRLDAVI